MNHLKTIGIITILVSGWFLILNLVAYVGTTRMTLTTDTAYPDMKPKTELLESNSIASKLWQRFDADWYLNIAKHGYYYQEDTQSSIVFFPLYPISIFFTAQITQDFAIAGVLNSLLFTFGAIILLYFLVKEELDEDSSWRSITLLLLFPTAFFLTSIYTESLFLFLSVLSFYLARKQHWWLAGLAGLLLTATRITGLAIIPALLWEYARQQNYSWQIIKHPRLLTLLLIPLGLFGYMAYLQGAFGNSTLFLKGQESWQRNHEISSKGIIDSFDQYKKKFSEIDPENSSAFSTRHIDIAFLIIYLAAVIAAWFLLPKPYALFMTLLIIPPLLSGRLQSIPRYALTAFPLFMLLGYISKHKLTYTLLATAFGLFLAFFIILFVNFHWVA